MKSNLYQTGTEWGLWLWTFIHTGHMKRLHLLKTPWASVYLHWILAPDPQPDPHDHPVQFVSIVLRGGYTERRHFSIDSFRVYMVRWLRLFNYSSVHRIIECDPSTLTLCIAWHPRGSRPWGFHTSKGWVHWTKY